MGENRVGFLEESSGNGSSMRLMCFLALLASFGAGYLEVKAGVPFPYITTMFLSSAFGGKAAQKFAERK